MKNKNIKTDSSFKWTKQLLQHIFAEQYEQGLRYLQVLYMHPKQALPILVLVSEERQIFIEWLTILFGENMVLSGNTVINCNTVPTNLKDNRLWVREIQSLDAELNHNMLDNLIGEIPNFLIHLIDLPKENNSKSRMAFKTNELNTTVNSI